MYSLSKDDINSSSVGSGEHIHLCVHPIVRAVYAVVTAYSLSFRLETFGVVKLTDLAVSPLMVVRGARHSRRKDMTEVFHLCDDLRCLASFSARGIDLRRKSERMFRLRRTTSMGDNSLPLFSRKQEGVSHGVRTVASGRPHQPTGTNSVAESRLGEQGLIVCRGYVLVLRYVLVCGIFSQIAARTLRT